MLERASSGFYDQSIHCIDQTTCNASCCDVVARMFEQLQQQMRALIVDVDVGQIPIGHGRREWFGTKLKLLEYVFQPVDTDLIHWDRNVGGF